MTIARVGNKTKLKGLPWGYDQDPKDKHLFHPNWELLFALEKAYEYLDKGVSLRATQDWIRQVTGKYISHVGLLKMYRRELVNMEKAKHGVTSLRGKKLEKVMDASKRRAAAQAQS